MNAPHALAEPPFSSSHGSKDASVSAFARSMGCARSPLQLDAEQRATLGLSNVEGIGTATLNALKNAFHSFADALAEPREKLLPFLQTTAARRALLAIPDLDEKTDLLLERLDGLKARVIFPVNDDWPVQLRGVDSYPLLYLRGEIDTFQPRLAVVGARDVDAYGTSITHFWAGELARKGIAIVSGGARGVDSLAHRAALDAQGVTIAVLGTGIGQMYPPQNEKLFECILEQGGALVSQFPLDMPPLQRNFILRNHLIAALADATLVTRAAHDSGALTTAKKTHLLGRAVFALPGDLSASLSWGTQRLIESRLAKPISGLEPIGRLFGLPGPWPTFFSERDLSKKTSTTTSSAFSKRSLAAFQPPKRDDLRNPLSVQGNSDDRFSLPAMCSNGASRPLPPLEEKILNVFRNLDTKAQQFDELLSQSDLDAAGLTDALLRLELLGLCEERPGRLFRLTAPNQGQGRS